MLIFMVRIIFVSLYVCFITDEYGCAYSAYSICTTVGWLAGCLVGSAPAVEYVTLSGWVGYRLDS